MKDDEIPLHWAANNGHVGAIELPLSGGANLETDWPSVLTSLSSAVSRAEEARSQYEDSGRERCWSLGHC